MKPLFKLQNISCSYISDGGERDSHVVLSVHELNIPQGRKVFIVGESGIGKSTILELLGLMNNTILPSADSRFVFCLKDGTEVDLLGLWGRNDDAELSAFRREHFSFIFQSTNLMRNFTAYENISITKMLQGFSKEESFRYASSVLEFLGLGHIPVDRMANELSGGQQQRLAFARAIVPDFTVLFGDEPTGNLDGENADRAMRLLSDNLNEFPDRSAIIVSHDMKLAVRYADVIVKIRKQEDSLSGVDGEKHYFGAVDNACCYYPAEDGRSWSNGLEIFNVEDFELFLRGVRK